MHPKILLWDQSTFCHVSNLHFVMWLIFILSCDQTECLIQKCTWSSLNEKLLCQPEFCSIYKAISISVKDSKDTFDFILSVHHLHLSKHSINKLMQLNGAAACNSKQQLKRHKWQVPGWKCNASLYHNLCSCIRTVLITGPKYHNSLRRQRINVTDKFEHTI